MTYENTLPGLFIDRPNRFIANIQIDGRAEVCHVKNTGRCRELLLPGAKVYVQRAANPQRKTRYDLISVYKGDSLVNIDSSAPNRVFREWAQRSGHWGNIQSIQPERRWGKSRFDFLLMTDLGGVFIETKGVTLEEGGIARFPDAPTERGVRHIQELIACQGEGYRAAIVFIIQMKGVHTFMPNDRTHAEFGRALRLAAASGVEIIALDCRVARGSLCVDRSIHVEL